MTYERSELYEIKPVNPCSSKMRAYRTPRRGDAIVSTEKRLEKSVFQSRII
jgi:hypothetical protein